MVSINQGFELTDPFSYFVPETRCRHWRIEAAQTMLRNYPKNRERDKGAEQPLGYSPVRRKSCAGK
jgi:hypothetical protein